MSAPGPRCVLFDLDGTLLDTAPDMVAAINRVRREEGLPPLPFAALRDHVSHGSAALVRLAFGSGQDPDTFERRRRAFLDHYRAGLCARTRLFPGLAEVLARLEADGLPWGVVTNKPAWLTDPLLAELGLAQRAACVLSGDSTPERKPHPLPLLTAAARCGVAPGRCLYLGDAERDIEAGNRAGMTTLIARWGYIDAGQAPQRWGADGALDHPAQLFDWLDTRLRA